jgi:hypothetical protein
MAAADNARNASDQFYAALNRMVTGDASSMAEIWSQSATVTTMHPIGGREVGWGGGAWGLGTSGRAGRRGNGQPERSIARDGWRYGL